MQPARNNEKRGPHRGGFTMIELLVVVTIIAILASLSLAVLNNSLENARIQATKATIRQLDSALQARIEAFGRINFRAQAQQFKALYDANNAIPPGGLPLELAEIMVRKDRFRAAFPQREEDLWGLNGAEDPTPPPFVDDSPLLRKMWNPSAMAWKTDSWRGRDTSSNPNFKEAAESSELLYVALTEGAVFGLPSLGIDRVNSRHIGDTDEDGNLEFLDDWGRPLRFYNWTTRLIRPAGVLLGVNQDISVAQFRASALVLMPDLSSPNVDPLPFNLYSHPLNQDPDDQTGALGAALVASPPNRFFVNPFSLGYMPAARAFSENFYHTPDTFHIPLIVSGGPDEQTGLFEPTGANPRIPADPIVFDRRLAMPLGLVTPPPSNASQLLDFLVDNITNRQL